LNAPDRKALQPRFCCPVCDRGDYEPVMGMYAGKPFHAGIYRCSNCGFGFVDPAPFRSSLRLGPVPATPV
jgi:hypothetical protein